MHLASAARKTKRENAKYFYKKRKYLVFVSYVFLPSGEAWTRIAWNFTLEEHVLALFDLEMLQVLSQIEPDAWGNCRQRDKCLTDIKNASSLIITENWFYSKNQSVYYVRICCMFWTFFIVFFKIYFTYDLNICKKRIKKT